MLVASAPYLAIKLLKTYCRCLPKLMTDNRIGLHYIENNKDGQKRNCSMGHFDRGFVLIG